MKNREISVFSLSLLDLLFCAFGGVIVLTVVFAAIVKYERAQVEKPTEIAIMLNVMFENAGNLSPRWELQARQGITANSELGSVTNDAISLLDTNWIYFSKINLSSPLRNQYSVGLEGSLVPVMEDSTRADTINLMMDYRRSDKDFDNTPDWLPPNGNIRISGFIFRPGELPEAIELPPLPPGALTDKKPVSIVLSSTEESFQITQLNP